MVRLKIKGWLFKSIFYIIKHGEKLRKIRNILGVISLVFLLIVLVGCQEEKHIVFFDAKGGQLTSDRIIEVVDGALIEEPSSPTNEALTFLGWYTSKDDGETLEIKWIFTENKVNKTMTLYAKWREELAEMLAYESYLNENNPVVTIVVKDYGTLVVELFPNVAENTVNNFINYVTSESYTNNHFHRIIAGFMIQGGMLMNSPNRPIKGEFASNGVVNDLKHDRGVISMARTTNPNSATSQFFIMHDKSTHLDGEYAAFGGLIEGFDVLDQIATVVTTGYPYDTPLTGITILNITINLNGYEPKEVIYY